MTTVVSLRGVGLERGGRAVLDCIDLDIGETEFIGVLGANGAGKTTLFQAILGLIRPHAGTIQVFGRLATRGNPGIGTVPQSRASLSGLRLRGRDLVGCVVDGHRLGLPLLSRAGRAEVDRALDLVGATQLAGRPVGELSGGERQRLLLAQALVGRPRLLLLDEPLISLDPHHAQAVVALARSLQRELRLTVLFSAHELNPLLPALDRVLYLGGGAAALGTVDEVITAPVLSRLYGTPIEVMRIGGRIFVMSGELDMLRADHVHDHDHHHGHHHHHA